jgi:hypothetical protein
MVLDNGLLRELDSPQALLANEQGLFKQLWQTHLRSHGAKHNASKSSSGEEEIQEHNKTA